MNTPKVPAVRRRVTRAKQSPLNAMRWSCDLACGHEVWVTAKRSPKTALCYQCGDKQTPEVGNG